MPQNTTLTSKSFTNWFKLKPKLEKNIKSPNFSEREVWNCHLGSNLGFEIDGKNKLSLRPVLVLKKLSKETFIGLPLTTNLKNGSWYYPSKIKQKDGRFVFSQVKVIDSKRLYNRIEKIDSTEFAKVKNAFITFLK